MASVWFSRKIQSTFFSSRLWLLFDLVTAVESVVAVVVLGGFLARGSFLPNCQSDEVVEQLFASVASVPIVSFVSSVVFDVEASFVDAVPV